MKLNSIYKGLTPINKMYRNGQTVNKIPVEVAAPEPHDYTKDYLTFEPISSAVTYSHGRKTFQYSLDGGETWSTCTTSQTVTVNVGQKMLLKGTFGDVSNDDDMNKFTANGGTWKAYGNLLSLIYSDNFASASTTLNNNGLQFCFYQCQNLINIDNLKIPITSITKTRGLRATFRDTGISSAPDNLLPATTLFECCYMGTFEDCRNLVNAPTLPARNIPSYGYFAMFNNCSSLNDVTCLATTNIGGNRTQLFLAGVAATGTFHKAASANWSTGQYGVPTGWTIDNYVEPTPQPQTTTDYWQYVDMGTPTPPLPYDAEIEYLESDGASYINTGIYLNTSNFEIGYEQVGVGTEKHWGYAHQGVPNGAWVSVMHDVACFGKITNNVNISSYLTSGNNTIKYTQTGITVNNTTKSKNLNLSGVDNLSTVPVPIFSWYDFYSRGMEYSENYPLKSFYIKNNGVLVLDMIPVRVGQVGYMYDKVSGQLFGNDGTGAFILGQDK